MRDRRFVVLGSLLLALMLLAPLAASAQSTDDPDGRARPSFVEGILDDDGQLWFKIGFYDVWAEEPPRDLFSLFWLLAITIGTDSANVGWETHDGVETFLGDPGTQAFILDNGCVIIATGLYPTDDYEVAIAAEYASWIAEATTSPIFDTTGFGTGSQFIGTGDPFTAFGGSPVWNLTTGETFTTVTTTTTTSTTSTTTTAATTTTTVAGSTTDDTTAATGGGQEPGSSTGGGFPWWLFGLGGLVVFLIWTYLNGGRIPGTNRYAYRVDTPALETMIEQTPETTPGGDRPTPPDTPTDDPGTTPPDTPAETPGTTPADTPTDDPGTTPPDTPADTPGTTPGDSTTPPDDPADTTTSGDEPTGGPEPITIVPAPVVPGDGPPKISIVSNGGTDSVNGYQMFRVVVEIPTDGSTPPPDEIEIEFESGRDTETLTIAWDGNARGPARYVSQPITLDKGAQGEGKSTWFGFLEFTVGGFEGLWFDNGEPISISYGGATVTTTAYDSWVDQGIGRSIIVTEWWRRYWTNLLEQLDGVEGPDADQARANAERGIGWADKAKRWYERDDILDTEKLAVLELYSSNIGTWFAYPPDAFDIEAQFTWRVDDKKVKYNERTIGDGGAQVALGLYRTVTEATWAAPGFTVFGTTIMGQEATWDEQVLSAVQLAGWATLGTGVSGFAGGVARGSFIERGVDAAADAARIARHADEAVDPFANEGWARVAFSPSRTRATGTGGADFDPVGSLDDVGAPRGITGGVRTPDTAARTARQRNDQIPQADRMYAKDFYIHGTEAGSVVPFVTDSGKPIAVSTVAKRIQDDPNWSPGVPVRLVSCHSANSGAASAVAAQLRTPVWAPTHRVSIRSDGSFKFHGDPLPPDPNFLDAAGNPRVRYGPAPADAGWIKYDETGAELGRLDANGTWHEGGRS